MTTIPETHRAFRRTTGTGTTDSPLKVYATTETTLPPGGLGPHQVLIKIHAVSLNYRDVLMLRGLYPSHLISGGIVASDCAASIAAIGSAVTAFSIGDRVSPQMDIGNLTGTIEPTGHLGLGGEVDGVLREYAVFDDKVLVRIPAHLSWEEAATIPCAGLTAWNALGAPGTFDKGKRVLIQGTGGVSLFALVLALAGGMEPIITSSSDKKLEALRAKLGRPDLKGYNYRTHKDQVAEVMRLTGGKGVDVVVNNSGPKGIPADLESLVPYYGTVSIVGFLEGTTADWNPGVLLGLIGKTARLQGVTVGSREDFGRLNGFLEERGVELGALVDGRVFGFGGEGVGEAFEYLWGGGHVGKVVIRL